MKALHIYIYVLLYIYIHAFLHPRCTTPYSIHFDFNSAMDLFKEFTPPDVSGIIQGSSSSSQHSHGSNDDWKIEYGHL